MIKLQIKNESVKANISPITLFLYKQEFDRDLLEDSITVIYQDYQTKLLSQIAWAMIKTVNHRLESYIQWRVDLDDEDIITNTDLIIYEINTRLLIKKEQTEENEEEAEEVKKDDKPVEVDIAILRGIIRNGIHLDLVNLMLLDTYLEVMSGDDEEEKTVMATPEQVDSFFLGI